MRDSQQAAARRRISNDSASRNAQRAERQQQHRAREQAAQHDKNTNRRKAKETRARVNSKGQCKKTQKNVHEPSRQHKRHRALRQWTKEADAASTTPTDAINTNVLQEPYVEHQAEERSCGFRSNLNDNDNNDSHSHQQPGAQPDDSQPPHPEL